MNRLLALEKIVELGSFTKAAKSLGYTQSAISQMITSLESEQGFQLVTRSRNGAHLTAEGAQLYPLMEQPLRQ
ncbi:MAG TPA: transcriptional regulator, partial [Lactobacillus sp.]|nr:transcriptional regulator [Lactobacillus sp.]